MSSSSRCWRICASLPLRVVVLGAFSASSLAQLTDQQVDRAKRDSGRTGPPSITETREDIGHRLPIRPLTGPQSNFTPYLNTWEVGAHTRGSDKSGTIWLDSPAGEGFMCAIVVREVSRIGADNTWRLEQYNNHTLKFNYDIKSQCTALGMYCPKSSAYVHVTAYMVSPGKGENVDAIIKVINNRRPYTVGAGGRGGRGIPWPDDVKCGPILPVSSSAPTLATTTQLFPESPTRFFATLDVECVDSQGSRIGNTVVRGSAEGSCANARQDALSRLAQREVCRYLEGRTNNYASAGTNRKWLQTSTCAAGG